MKKLIIVLTIMFLASSVYADKIQVPFGCWPKELQEEFKQVDRKLDLNGNDRDENSWGYLDNKGCEYWIITYTNIPKEDLELIKNIAMKIEMKKRGKWPKQQ